MTDSDSILVLEVYTGNISLTPRVNIFPVKHEDLRFLWFLHSKFTINLKNT